MFFFAESAVSKINRSACQKDTYFLGPTLEEQRNVVHKIQCELGEIYYQTKQNGEVSKGGDTETNGLFISNEKIQELMYTGEIKKYGWLLELAITGVNSFVFGSSTSNQTKLDKNSSSYYSNGLFIPLKLDKEDKKNNNVTFKLPFDDRYKVDLHFKNKQSNYFSHNEADIKETKIYFFNNVYGDDYKGIKKRNYTYGVKQQYSQDQGESTDRASFFANYDGKDVTNDLQQVMVVDNIEKYSTNKAVTVGYLPNDFDSGINASDQWVNSGNRFEQRVSIPRFNMYYHNGNLKLDVKKKDVFDLYIRKHMKKYLDCDSVNCIKIGTDTDGEECRIYKCTKCFKPGGDKKEFEIKLKLPYMVKTEEIEGNVVKRFAYHAIMLLATRMAVQPRVEVKDGMSLGVDEQSVVQQWVDKINDSFPCINAGHPRTDADSKTMVATYDKIKETLQDVDLDLNLYKSYFYEFADGGHCCRLYNENKNEERFVQENGEIKRVKIFQDEVTGKHYYREYNDTLKKCEGELKEVENQTFAEVYTDPIDHSKDYTQICFSKGDKLFAATVHKDLSEDLETLMPRANKYLTYMADNYFAGKTGKTIDEALNGTTDEHQAFVELTNAMDHGEHDIFLSTFDTKFGNDNSDVVYTKDGKIKIEDETFSAGEDVAEINNKLKEIKEKTLQKEIEDNRNDASVLSSGELYDFCASQIGCMSKKKETKAETKKEIKIQKKQSDPTKETADNYFKEMADNYFKEMANVSSLYRYNFHERKAVNNTPHVNKHLQEKFRNMG